MHAEQVHSISIISGEERAGVTEQYSLTATDIHSGLAVMLTYDAIAPSASPPECNCRA